MEHPKESTKAQLASCFKQLVITTNFERITIKMITDQAGVIRPTFYKHFQDKYEVIEWLFQQDIIAKVDIMLENHMERDAIHLLFICLYKDHEYYRHLYQLHGANSFEQLLGDYIYRSFLQLLDRLPTHPAEHLHHLTKPAIAHYYTFGLTGTIQMWLTSEQPDSPNTMYDAYLYLAAHSVFDQPV